MKQYKCVAFGDNGNGEPDIWFVIVELPEHCYDEGDHYKIVEDDVTTQDFESRMVVDEHDHLYGHLNLESLIFWETSSIIQSLDGKTYTEKE